MDWATSHHILSDNGEMIAEAICRGTVIVVTDGSFKADFGTAAYVMEGEDAMIHLTAVNEALGNLTNQIALCSDLSGCYGVVSMVRTICEEHHIT